MSHKPGYARGINNSQRVRLLALAEDGCSVEEISGILRVDEDIVENWMPQEEEKPKRVRRTKEQIAADKAAEEAAKAAEEG